MTKQYKILEGLAKHLYEEDKGEVGVDKARWEMVVPALRNMYFGRAKRALVHLASEGVVIGADRELPAISWGSSDSRYDQAYSRGIAKGISMAKEAGYVATESLVEE